MIELPITYNFNEHEAPAGTIRLTDEAADLLRIMPEQCITFSFAGEGMVNPETEESIEPWTVQGAALIANHLLPRGKYKDLHK